MNKLHSILICCLLAAATVLLILACFWLQDERAQVGAVQRVAASEGDATRKAIVNWLDKNVGPVIAESRNTLVAVNHQVDMLPSQVLTVANAQLTGVRGDLVQVVQDSVTKVMAPVEGIRADLQPILKESQQTLATTSLTMHDLRPQLLGLVAASKVTAGQAALTLRDIQVATPQFIGTWQSFGGHMDAMSAAGERSFIATQHTMENFAAASKPLPTWARIALGVGPPVAQAGAAAVGAGVALGWLKPR